jgi:hypothetical protein
MQELRGDNTLAYFVIYEADKYSVVIYITSFLT